MNTTQLLNAILAQDFAADATLDKARRLLNVAQVMAAIPDGWPNDKTSAEQFEQRASDNLLSLLEGSKDAAVLLFFKAHGVTLANTHPTTFSVH